MKMELLYVDQEKSFSYIWTIQNYSFCFRKEDELFYQSRTFVINENSGEKWFLRLYPKRYFSHDDIGLELQRFTTAEQCREITLEIFISDIRGSFEKQLTGKFPFNLEPAKTSILKLIVRKKSFDNYLNSDSITLKFKILEKNILTSRQCYAKTIICVERITYLGTLEGFEDLENDAPISKKVIILSDVPFFTMNLISIRENCAVNKIYIEIELAEPKKKCYSTCEISLVDAVGNIVHSVRDECNFHTRLFESKQVWTFPFIEVSKILNNKDLYLSNGTLRLHCKFVVSSGETQSHIERTEYGNGIIPQLKYCSETLKDNLRQFYTEGKFSDFTIRAQSKEFRVHKTILCARSKVFSAMFERDMKESREGIVEIDDLEDDTVSKMLLFLYTDTVGEDLEFGTASSLYFAADKYGIMGLKRKCSDFLKGHLTVTNVCGVLVLVDMHQDEELKSDAQKFIFEHSGEVMKSTEWEKFMKDNIYLASEIMHTLLKR